MQIRKIIVLTTLLIAPLAFASAPVVDASQDSNNANAQDNFFTATPEPMVPDAGATPNNQNLGTASNYKQSITVGTNNASSSATNTKSITTLPPASETPTIPPPDVSNLSESQRLARLEQQVNNLVQLNLPQRLDNLQNEIEKLNGQGEQQAHDLKALSDQLRDFYADLAHRLNAVKTGTIPNTADTTALNTAGNGAAGNITEASSTLQTASSTLPQSPNAEAIPEQQSLSKEDRLYNGALALMQKKKYGEAATELNTYLKNFPKGAYSVNAFYWLGECYYLQNQFDKAASTFKTLIDRYPNSTKTADATLKLGISYASVGKNDLARKAFLEVQKRYPASNTAKLASKQLATL